MSFAIFPPEINSGLIYTGPGSGSLLAAASAWNSLASDLISAATSSHSVIGNLTTGPWTGPSATTMASAAAPYLGWLHATAANAEQAGAQAAAAAGAYETAHASSVPPPVIAANRAQLASLVATNWLGQNTPAIAANEAHYMSMWAQDALAMDTYAGASQHATALPQQIPAPQVAHGMPNPAGAIQSAATNAAGLAQQATPAAAANPLSGLLGGLGGSAAGPAAAGAGGSSLAGLQAIYYPALLATLPLRVLLGLLIQLARGAGSAAGLAGASGTGTLAGSEELLTNVGNLIDGKLKLVSGGVANQLRAFGSAISAKLASAHSLNGLSVPQSWSTGTAMGRAAPELPATTVSPATPAPSAGMPGGPFGQAMLGALSGRGLSTLSGKVPGPKVVPKSPAGG
jgi:PPE-repeat protein